jgi:membrane-bound metal-dependent hydrolase YbcI (DUF457 family)
MFIGHYGVSFAAKRLRPCVSLAVLFLAVQLLDVLFALFVLVGVERMRIVPGFTAYNPYDLDHMPFTHSLVGSLFWSALAALAFLVLAQRVPPGPRRRTAAILGAAVFSHFVLDVPMHTPDMPLGLGADSPKIGLGLWNYRWPAVAAELAVLIAGGILYLRASRPRRRPAVGTYVFGSVLVAVTIATPFFPIPPSPGVFAVQALAGYFLFAAAAGWFERSRPIVEDSS